jgi:hypothetical protein
MTDAEVAMSFDAGQENAVAQRPMLEPSQF